MRTNKALTKTNVNVKTLTEVNVNVMALTKTILVKCELRRLDYVDDDIDLDQSDFELKIENDHFFILTIELCTVWSSLSCVLCDFATKLCVVWP